MAVKLPRNWRGPYRAKPKAPKGYRVVQPGPKWQRQFKDGRPRYVLATKKPAGPRQPRQPARPGPEIPYSEYADYPFFQRSMIDLDRQQEAAQGYVSDKVSPWLAAALRGLTGVDPAQPGFNPAVQQQYLANVQGQVGGALNAAAGAVGPMPMSTTPGGIVASPTAYESDAARTAAAQRSSAALQSAQAQSALNTLQPNTLAQGAVMALSDYAKGLPGLYAQRRAEQRSKIDQFIMEFEEDKRRADRNAAIQSMQAQANIAMSFGQLGLDAKELEAQLNQQPPGMPTNLPPGLVAVPNDQGGWDIREDPSFQGGGGGGGGGGGSRGGTSTRDAQGRRRVPWLQEEGYTRLPPRYVQGGRPRVNRQAFDIAQGADGNWWIRRKGSGGSGGSAQPPNKRMGLNTLITSLRKDYDPLADGSIADRNAGKPKKAAEEVARWIIERKNSFVRGNTRQVDWDKLDRVLLQAIGGGGEGSVIWHVGDILRRGYITGSRWR